MKCKIFIGKWYDAQDAFNKWAKGKALTREVLIQTQHVYVADSPKEHQLIIFVIHPDDPYWDKTEEAESIQPVQQGVS